MCVTCSMTWQRPDLSTYLVAICALYLHLDFVFDFPFLKFFSLFVFLLIYFLLFLVGWWIGVQGYTYTLGAGDNFWTKLSYANSTCFSILLLCFSGNTEEEQNTRTAGRGRRLFSTLWSRWSLLPHSEAIVFFFWAQFWNVPSVLEAYKRH